MCRHAVDPPSPAPCVTYSLSVASLWGPGQSPVHPSPHDAGRLLHLPLKVCQAAVLTPPFLFLHWRRVVVVKTLRIHTALTFGPQPMVWHLRSSAPVEVAAITPTSSLKQSLALTAGVPCPPPQPWRSPRHAPCHDTRSQGIVTKANDGALWCMNSESID